MKKRSPSAIALLLLTVALGLLGLCGWFVVVRPVAQAMCFTLPDSLRNPPIPPNAKEVKSETPDFMVGKDYAGKRITFQTTDNPAVVYEFYHHALGTDGWLEDADSSLAAGANLIDARFTFKCGIDTPDHIATLWIYSEVGDAGKTMITINSVYLQH